MTKVLNELKELSHRYNDVAMLAMDATDFERYFAGIYGLVNHFKMGAPTSTDSVAVVDTACQLLECAVQYHQNNVAHVTEKAVHIFEQTVKLLFSIVIVTLGVNEAVYQRARETRLKLKALRACGITLPGHMPMPRGRWQDTDADLLEKNEALRYARENVEQFTQFAFNLGNGSTHASDPFQGRDADGLRVYERLIALRQQGVLVLSRSYEADPNVRLLS